MDFFRVMFFDWMFLIFERACRILPSASIGADAFVGPSTISSVPNVYPSYSLNMFAIGQKFSGMMQITMKHIAFGNCYTGPIIARSTE